MGELKSQFSVQSVSVFGRVIDEATSSGKPPLIKKQEPCLNDITHTGGGRGLSKLSIERLCEWDRDKGGGVQEC